MKGKNLEILVLVVAFVILLGAMFLMFIGDGSENNVKAISLVNRLFSLGFLVYIAYSYILSTNLNKEIMSLESHVDNLKQEVGRKRKTITKQTNEIKTKDVEISSLTDTNQKLEVDFNAAKTQLAKTESDLKKALDEIKPKGDGENKE